LLGKLTERSLVWTEIQFDLWFFGSNYCENWYGYFLIN